MSKSDDTGKGVIFLNDDPEVAVKKIMSATTDSFAKINYDYDNQPGISNLIDILASLSEREVSEVAKEYRGQDTYGPLKTATANAVKEFLIDFKQKLSCVDESKLIEKLEQSEEAMNKVANTTLARVQKAVGLRR
jgi:tryptophanyl-tRNA synthetase